MFLDEFGASTNMNRTHARGPRGQRVVCKTPHGHWKILSTIAAMTVQGVLCCGTFDGATDTDTFLAFVREGLVPHLKPGQVVVMDNLGAHRPRKVRELIEDKGCELLYLPPYSPDLNPIEEAFSKVKHLLRKIGPRTKEALVEAMGRALGAVSAQDIGGYFVHCGYRTPAQQL